MIDFLEHEISLKGGLSTVYSILIISAILGDSEAERKSLLQAGRLNLALCYLKLGKWIEARAVCDKVGTRKWIICFR